MAIGQGIRAGKAFVQFVLDDKRFKRELHTMRGSQLAVGKAGLSVTGPLIAGFTAAAATFATTGSELFDMSKRTGLSVESLSELKFAAQQSGVSLSVLERAAREMQKKGISPELFDKYADSISSITDPTKRAQKAMEIFGKRSGTALLPMLEDLPRLRQQARDLAVTMSTQNATAADNLGDGFDAAKAQFVALLNQIGAAVAGPLTDFLTWSQGVLAWTIEFIKQNPDLVQAIAAVAGGILAASTAALALGAALTLISATPIGIAIGAVIGGGALIAHKLGAFDGMVNIPKVAPAVAPRSGVSNSAARIANAQSSDILKYSRQTATGVNKLVGLYQRQGLIAGTG